MDYNQQLAQAGYSYDPDSQSWTGPAGQPVEAFELPSQNQLAQVAAPAPAAAPAPVQQMTGLSLLEQTKQLKSDLAILKAAQVSEIALLKDAAKDAGLSSKEINALIKQETAANKAEYNAASKAGAVTKNEAGLIASDIAVARLAGLLPKQQEAVQETQTRVADALQFIDDNNLSQGGAKKGVGTLLKTGYVLSEISAAQTPEEAQQVAKGLSNLVAHPSEAVVIAQELKTSTPEEGEKLKQVPNNAGVDPKLGNAVYTTRKVGDGRTLTTVYLERPDGSITEMGNTYQSVNTKEGLGTIGNLIVGGLASLVIGPQAAALFGGGTAGAIAGGAIAGGLSSEITGGDFLKGALGGAVGGAFSTSVPGSVGNNVANAVTDSLRGVVSDAVAKQVGQAVASSALGATRAIIAGSDVLDAAALSALGSGVQSTVSNELAKLNLPDVFTNKVSAAVSQAMATGVVAAAQGQDFTTAVGSSLIQSGIQTVGQLAYTGAKTVLAGTPTPAPSSTPDRVAGATSELDSGGLVKTGGQGVAPIVEVTSTPIIPPGLYSNVTAQEALDLLAKGVTPTAATPEMAAQRTQSVDVDKTTYNLLKEIALEAANTGITLPFRLDPKLEIVYVPQNQPESLKAVEAVQNLNREVVRELVSPTVIPSVQPSKVTPTITPAQVSGAGSDNVPGSPAAGGGGGGGGGATAADAGKLTYFGPSGGGAVSQPIGQMDQNILYLTGLGLPTKVGKTIVPTIPGFGNVSVRTGGTATSNLGGTDITGTKGTGTSVGGGEGAGTGAGTVTGAGTGTGSGTGAGTGSGVGTGTGSGTGEGVGAGTGAGAGTGVGTGTGTGTGTGAGGGDGSGTGDGTGAGEGTGTGGGVGGGTGTGVGDGTGTGATPTPSPAPSPSTIDNTLITFLGLTPPPAPKAQPVRRGSAPTLYTGGEEGDLNALFGGKPEELQDVWNQASLRLRSALGI